MAEDPYKYFRIEAREIVEALTRGGLDLERGRSGKETVGQLLRVAHTLKGAARVVGLSQVSDLAHAIEDALSPHQDDAAALPAERVEMIVTLVEAVAASIRAVDAEPPAPDAHPSGTGAAEDGARDGRGRDDFGTVRVEIAEMDTLLAGIAEAAVQVGSFRGAVADVGSVVRDAAALVDRVDRAISLHGTEVESLSQVRALAVELGASLERARRKLVVAGDRAAREIAQVRERTDRARLIPVGLVFDPLERAARDAATELGRSIDFQVAGGDIRLDQPVLSALRDGLLHVVRNAVAHGIEPVEERAAAGKPRAGRIELRVERRRSRVTVTCADDGRGVDVDAVRRVALARGLITADEASDMGLGEAVMLLRRGGLSTAASVSQIAGRGVGLSVLGGVAERFKGELDLTTQPGRGTTISITVPVSLTSLPALVAEASDVVVAFPRDAVSSTVRLKQSEIVRGVEGETIVSNGRAIPFAPLATILGLPSAAASRPGAFCNVVLVQTDASAAAIGVDRIHGLYALVVRPLPRAAGRIAAIAGASLDADGNPWLVLDPAGLVGAVRVARGGAAARELAPRLPILVVDDSLTTRMLERTILETAGYEVDVATSGEEGLAKAEARRYGVFIVDVEMPGIDGFEFVRRTRADANLRDTPAILVTSLNSPEHKRRGMEVGARGYIVKSEFDELALLGIIRGLIG
jgi:two-component system chemotaxis sensor kinase CheA